MRSASLLALSLVLLSLSCNRSPDPNQVVGRLPELPAYFADNLEATKIPNVLMTKAPAPIHKPADAKATVPKPRAPKQRSCVDKFAGYVVYPLTVCFPPFDLVNTGELAAIESQTTPSGWSPASSSTRYYKLSKSNTVAFTDRLFCRQSGGPWYAEVTTTISCEDSVPDISQLAIIAGPQPFGIVWDGDLRDIPPPFNPSSFGFVGESCTCCAGFTQCPDGRCLPHGVSCTITPAAKEPLPK